MDRAMMDSALVDGVRGWVLGAIPGVSLQTPQSIALDNLDPYGKYAGDEVISLIVLTYLTAVEMSTRFHHPVQVMMVVSLNPSNNRSEYVSAISVQTLITDINTMIPPKLYLVDWSARMTPWIIEEYRLPLASTILSLNRADTYVYYREYRLSLPQLTLPVIDDWRPDTEFERCIYIEHFPSDIPYSRRS